MHLLHGFNIRWGRVSGVRSRTVAAFDPTTMRLALGKLIDEAQAVPINAPMLRRPRFEQRHHGLEEILHTDRVIFDHATLRHYVFCSAKMRKLAHVASHFLQSKLPLVRGGGRRGSKHALQHCSAMSAMLPEARPYNTRKAWVGSTWIVL